MSVQTSFTGPIDRSREILSRAARDYDPDHITIAVSGGTDSIVAADVIARLGPEYGLAPNSVTHIRTGTGIPQTRLAARLIAALHGLEWIEQGYRNPQDALAPRVLNNGWPAGFQGSPVTGGHGLEWANRKDKPMDEVYMRIDGQQVWVSGARKLESKSRQGNVPDNGLQSDKPRRTWLSPIVGWTAKEKRDYIKDRGLPVSEAYVFLGFSGECTACSFDERGLLHQLQLIAPELATGLETLAVWVYLRWKRGDLDVAPKRLCWGWQPDGGKMPEPETDPTQDMTGCNAQTCKEREAPSWIRPLPDWQLVTRADVQTWWDQGIGKVRSRYEGSENNANMSIGDVGRS